MKFVIIIMVLFSLFLTGCFFETPIQDGPVNVSTESMVKNSTMMQNETGEVLETNFNTTLDPEVEQEGSELENQTGCTDNSECEWDEQCIDGGCGKITELYETEGCEVLCNYDEIVIETSDGDLFTLSRGKGDYTGGGAVEWVVSTGPDYCQGGDIIVPVKIMKKNYGAVISEEYVTVGIAEESPLITHPTSSVEFTFEVQSVEETCG